MSTASAFKPTKRHSKCTEPSYDQRQKHNTGTSNKGNVIQSSPLLTSRLPICVFRAETLFSLKHDQKIGFEVG